MRIILVNYSYPAFLSNSKIYPAVHYLPLDVSHEQFVLPFYWSNFYFRVFYATSDAIPYRCFFVEGYVEVGRTHG